MKLTTTARIGTAEFPVVAWFEDARPDVIGFDFYATVFVEWDIGRDLLAAGLMSRTGERDVQVWPDPDTDEVAIKLTSPTGCAVIRIAWDAVAGFVRHTYDAVPRGAEYDAVDWDAFPGLDVPAGGAA